MKSAPTGSTYKPPGIRGRQFVLALQWGMHLFQLDEVERRRAGLEWSYLEFLRVPSLSVAVYSLRAGEEDRQQPHMEDEVYYVASGRASIQVGDEDQVVRTGSIVFVPARVEHRFHDIAEDLSLIVFFAPAEGTASA
jgi:mannose-6-phosphate isomerase-like protein (cupin superfamily)